MREGRSYSTTMHRTYREVGFLVSIRSRDKRRRAYALLVEVAIVCDGVCARAGGGEGGGSDIDTVIWILGFVTTLEPTPYSACTRR